MKKSEIIEQLLLIENPNIREEIEKLQDKFPKLSYQKLVDTISKTKYNLKEELEIHAQGITLILKTLFPNREISNAKLDVWILGKHFYKECKHCLTVKTFEEFAKNKSNKYGINTYCKPCQLETTSITQAFRQSKYRSSMLDRTPSWAELDKIQEFYEKCPKGCHVDHIIPLQGDIVSGFHVLSNLQYLNLTDNCSKGNSFDIEKFNSNELWYNKTNVLQEPKPKLVVKVTTEEKLHLTKEDVQQLIWDKPFSVGCKDVGLTDNGLKKMAIRLECIMPPLRYHVKSDLEKKRLRAIALSAI